jgi:DNA-binding beta-propeller fold protein YncE
MLMSVRVLTVRGALHGSAQTSRSDPLRLEQAMQSSLGLIRTAAILLVSVMTTTNAAQQPPLEPIAEISMPAVRGRIDHLSFDSRSNRLFVAALGNDTVEVIDVSASRVTRSLKGFGEPQRVLYVPDRDRLYVANGSADRVDVLDGRSFESRKRFSALSDADNVRHDAAARRVYVGYGKGALRAIDTEKEEVGAVIVLAGHPESFQLETNGSRIFVNVPQAKHVAVVDRNTNAVISSWSTDGVSRNFPMTLDETTHRLFVGARQPAVMLVYDTDSGKIVAKLPIGEDTDDIFFDGERKRVYVICGEGRIDVFGQNKPDTYTRLQWSRTSAGARTGLWVRETSRLYVAAPAMNGSPARLLVYQAH